CGGPEPHAAHGWRGRLLCRLDRGPVSAPPQHRGIQSRRAAKIPRRPPAVRRRRRTGRARALRGAPLGSSKFKVQGSRFTPQPAKEQAMTRRSGTSSLIRSSVRALHAYMPGEQPKIPGLIKLNTNENPYPPSPKVLAAIQAASDGRLRLYPNPTAQPLREKLAQRHGCRPDNIIVGNGSDELLALATRAFVEPLALGSSSQPHRSTI